MCYDENESRDTRFYSSRLWPPDLIDYSRLQNMECHTGLEMVYNKRVRDSDVRRERSTYH